MLSILEGQCKFMVIFQRNLKMRRIADRRYRENQNIRFMFDKIFFPENHAVYGVMWVNMVQTNKPQMMI